MSLHAGMSILVVEDDDTCRTLARNILEAAGFKVICARDSHEAIDFVDNGSQIDVALVDLRLPPGTPSGVSFARMAQQRRLWLKIVFMSGSIRPQDFTVFDETDAFLHKPFAPQHLLEIVSRAAA